MTRIEKETVIAALAMYRDNQKKAEARDRKRGELKKATEHGMNKNIADGLVSTFCEILTIPCGECRI